MSERYPSVFLYGPRHAAKNVEPKDQTRLYETLYNHEERRARDDDKANQSRPCLVLIRHPLLEKV